MLCAPLICLLFGCGGQQLPTIPKCKVAGLEASLTAAQRLNMDEEGNSLPLVVRMFQLKSATAIKNADFEAMWQDPKEALGEDLLSVAEMTLFPDQTEVREIPRESDARYVAVMGVFRKQTGTTWRAWKRIQTPNAAECKRNDEPIRSFKFVFSDYRIEASTK